VSCGVGGRRGWDLALLRQLTAPIQPLAWELPYAMGEALKKTKKKKKRKKKNPVVCDRFSDFPFLDELDRFKDYGSGICRMFHYEGLTAFFSVWLDRGWGFSEGVPQRGRPSGPVTYLCGC